MRRAGRPSWRFAHDIDQGLHVLLDVRDALGLEGIGGGDGGPAAPPPLLDGPPARPGTVDASSRTQAAQDWSAWWSRVVAERARVELGQTPEGLARHEWIAEVAEAHRTTFDPPEWASLVDTPLLRRAASERWREACDWFTPARSPYLPPGCRDVFAWERVRAAAEEVATSRQVGVGALNGCALVLLVEGRWWTLVEPGVAVCSVGAARDPEATDAILAEVFTSCFGAAP